MVSSLSFVKSGQSFQVGGNFGVVRAERPAILFKHLCEVVFRNYADNVSLFRDSVVPEPGTIALLLAGSVAGAGMLLRRRRK